jgi:PfaB family protein
MSFGYSLGENSMMFAAGVWNQGEAALQRLQQSALFKERISGKQSAIHEFWQENQPGSVKGPAWANYILMGDAHNLQTEIDQTPKVYLTHINTPRQVVIGGAPQACEDFIALRKINFIKAPFNHALHCEPVQSEWQEFHYLHDWPINETPDYDIYTAATYEKSELTSGAIARNIAQTLTTPLDFPRLVGKVYEDGARIFIETGAGSNCSKWIDHILKNKEHLSVSINQHGVGDGLSVLRCLAKCISHRIPVDLEALVNKKHQPSRLVVKG